MDLSGANPALDLLLAGNGVTNVRELLEVHEPGDVIPACEARGQALLVFVDTACEVVGDADIQHARATGHDVHVVDPHSGHTVAYSGIVRVIIFRRPGAQKADPSRLRRSGLHTRSLREREANVSTRLLFPLFPPL